MEQTKLNKFKKQLETARVQIEEEIKRNEIPPDFGSDIDHFDEETDKTEETGNQESVVEVLKRRLSEFDIALGKIEAGSYGICEKCGTNIEEEILNIDPESRFCKACKASQ